MSTVGSSPSSCEAEAEGGEDFYFTQSSMRMLTLSLPPTHSTRLLEGQWGEGAKASSAARFS